MSDVLQLLLGIAVLAVGADILVRGSVALAALLRIPHLVVGLTIVSFGTSALRRRSWWYPCRRR